MLRFGLAIILGICLYNFQDRMSWGGGGTGLRLFQTISTVNIYFVYLSSYCLFLVILHEEKEDETFGMIMMTGVSPFAYILGRCGSRIMTLLLMLLIQLPFTLLCVTFGGITLKSILLTYLFILALMLFMSGLCFLVSMFTRTFFTAALISFILSSVINFSLSEMLGTYGFFKNLLMPVKLLEDYLSAGRGIVIEANLIDLSTKYLILGSLSFLLALVFFNRANFPKAKKVNSLFWLQCLQYLKQCFPSFQWRPKKRRFGKRALVIKEIYFSFYGKQLWLAQIAFLVLCGLYYFIDYNSRVYYFFGEYGFISFMCLSVLCFNQFFAREIKNNTFATLLTLPGSVRKIFWAKFGAYLLVLAPTILSLLVLLYFKETYSKDRFYNNLSYVVVFLFIGMFINFVCKQWHSRIITYVVVLLFTIILSNMLSSRSIRECAEVLLPCFFTEAALMWLLCSLYVKRYSFFCCLCVAGGGVFLHIFSIQIIYRLVNYGALAVYYASFSLWVTFLYAKIVDRMAQLGESS